MRQRTALYLILLVLACGTALGQPYAGTYTLRTPDGLLTLTLVEREGGLVSGSLTGPGLSFDLDGRTAADGIAGTVTSPTERLSFAGQLCESRDHLFLLFGQRDASGQIRQSDAIRLTLERAPDRPRGAPGASSPESGVVINGERLSPQTVLDLERRYGVPVPDGDYWYDKISGAWGFTGGPTVGYTVPGLEVGGRLRENASNGTTSVWVNGRRLHVTEVLALQQMVGVVYPGRYWFDSRGNYGFEGYGAMGNLWEISRRSGGRQEGILSTYDKAGGTLIGGMFLNQDD